jgi:molecular chaperone GrpE
LEQQYLNISDIRNRRKQAYNDLKKISEIEHTNKPEETKKEDTKPSKKIDDTYEPNIKEPVPDKLINEDLESIKLKYVHVCADLQNLQKRIESDKLVQEEHYIGYVVKEFLPLIDSLTQISYPANLNPEIVKGIDLMKEQLKEILENLGVKEINDFGMEFNPKYNEAVSTSESKLVKTNHISKVLRIGYKVKHNVIRPSLVEVEK